MAALKTLLENLDVTVVRGTTQLDVPDVVYDSRKITKGCLFICIEGANFDGHSAAAQAVEKRGCGSGDTKGSRRTRGCRSDDPSGGGYPLRHGFYFRCLVRTSGTAA